MKIVLVQEAEMEFWASVRFYESQKPGLGLRFKQETARSLAQIAADPTRSPLRRKGYRRVNLSVFPHYIAYAIRSDVVWVVAIGHAHRRPEYWLERIKDRSGDQN